MKAKTESYVDKIVAYFNSQPIMRAWLFGSYSRGEETEESDIDILVDYDKETRISLMQICKMIIDLEDILKKKVDLVERRGLKDFAVESVNLDKVLIYERVN